MAAIWLETDWPVPSTGIAPTPLTIVGERPRGAGRARVARWQHYAQANELEGVSLKQVTFGEEYKQAHMRTKLDEQTV
jgi:hypothetical protein